MGTFTDLIDARHSIVFWSAFLVQAVPSERARQNATSSQKLRYARTSACLSLWEAC